MRKRLPKRENVMESIRSALDNGQYLDTVHAAQRQLQRKVTRPEYLYVLRHGFHEKAKDKYDVVFGAWNYAVRGKTVDKRELRVVVSFDTDGLLIITVIEIGA